jgi:hypothetical protein
MRFRVVLAALVVACLWSAGCRAPTYYPPVAPYPQQGYCVPQAYAQPQSQAVCPPGCVPICR